MADGEWVNSVVQLATGAGFGSLVWYFVVRHIPAIEERHRVERLAIMLQMKDRDERLENMLREYHAALRDHIKCLAEVCDMLKRINEKLDE